MIPSSEMGSSSDACVTRKSFTLSENSDWTRSPRTAPRLRRVGARLGRGTNVTIKGTQNRMLLSMTMWNRLGPYQAGDKSPHAVALLHRRGGLLLDRSCLPSDLTMMTFEVRGQENKVDR